MSGDHHFDAGSRQQFQKALCFAQLDFQSIDPVEAVLSDEATQVRLYDLNGCDSKSATAPVCTFDDGQHSSGMR